MSVVCVQHTHYPQYAGPKAAGRTLRGPYGDALAEFDDTVGDIMAALEKSGVINNTLIFFTSDNGYGDHFNNILKADFKEQDLITTYLYTPLFEMFSSLSHIIGISFII